MTISEICEKCESLPLDCRVKIVGNVTQMQPVLKCATRLKYMPYQLVNGRVVRAFKIEGDLLIVSLVGCLEEL